MPAGNLLSTCTAWQADHIANSSECLEEAKRRVYSDPQSNRSWNFCWLVLTKIQNECVFLKLSAASNCGWLWPVNLFPITPTYRLHSQPCGAIVSLPPKVWRSYPVLSSPNGIGLWIRCSDTGINHPAVKGCATLPACPCTICTSTYISSTPVRCSQS